MKFLSSRQQNVANIEHSGGGGGLFHYLQSKVKYPGISIALSRKYRKKCVEIVYCIKLADRKLRNQAMWRCRLSTLKDITRNSCDKYRNNVTPTSFV
jgi:hypothetical protein